MTDKIVVLVMCGSRKEARKIARELVERRLAACVNEIGAAVRSVYRWKGKVETAEEFLLVIKTTKRRFAGLREIVRELHSYAVPEIIGLPIVEGSRAYLDWIAESVGTGGRSSMVRTSKRDPSLRSG
ncbi:MAG: divalent-cation tolerance protein CutA [Candidatus Acidiferrales bacterium]